MRSLPIVMAVAAAALIVSCSSESEPGPAATAGPSPAASPRPQATPLPISDRVTFYAADPADAAGTVAAGDFNGDGVTDVLFAAAFGDGPDNQRPDAGEAYIFLGPFRPGETRDAAAGEQDATIYGADDGDQASRSAAAGDINGDGIDDIILGAPFGDGPNGDRQDSGEVLVIFGSSRLGREQRIVDLRDGADLSLYGAGEEDLAGFDVAVAHLNGTTAADLIVGAFWADGPDRSRPRAGAVYVVYGSDQLAGAMDLAAEEADVTVYGADADDRLGESVAAGDVNGDGLDDLVIAAPFAAGAAGVPEAGQTYVIYSPAPAKIDLLAGQPDVIIYGVDDGDQLGHGLAVGDVSADGMGDILLTAVSADGVSNKANLSGEAALVLGASLPATIDVAAGEGDMLIYGADSEDRLGRSGALGDIDGDGRADLLLGAPGADGIGEASSNSGEVYVVTGSAAPENALRLPSGALVYAGDDAGDNLASEIYGRRPILAVDVDGDAVDEILVAAPLGDGPEESRRDCGEAYLLFVGPLQDQ